MSFVGQLLMSRGCQFLDRSGVFPCRRLTGQELSQQVVKEGGGTAVSELSKVFMAVVGEEIIHDLEIVSGRSFRSHPRK